MVEKSSTLQCIVFYFGIFFFLKVSGQSTSLAITPQVVDEGSPQTITCIYSGSETVASVSWFANDIIQGSLKVNGVCTKIFWRNENLHSYSCDVSTKTFKLTILSVTRNNRSDIWRCEIAFVGLSVRLKSNNVTPSVKVFITSIAMTIPQSDTVTIQEKTTQQFRCITSGGLPEPIVKWYNDSRTPGDTSDDKEITSLITPLYSNTSDDLVITTSTLTMTALKYDNQINIYCSAYSSSDQTPLISTRKSNLNVLYAPDGPPVIQGFSARTTYRVIENKPGQLTCLVKGGNPLPTLTWTCFNTGTSDNTDANTVSKTARWTAVRGQNRKCTCQSSHSSGSAMVEIQVQILYPPTTPVFSIKNTEVVGTVKVIKNNQVSITCRSTGQPNQIQYTWKLNSASTSGATLTTNNIRNGDQYTCEVENSMNPSDGSTVSGKNSSSLSFEVLYPPEVGILNNRSIPEGKPFDIYCSVKVGNPKETTFKWRKSDGTIWSNQMLTIRNVSRTNAGFYTCTADNLMKQTGEQTATKVEDSKNFYLNVWYRAKVTDFYVVGFPGKTSVTVNEITGRVPFHCDVDSNPGSSMTIKKEEQQLHSGSDRKSLEYVLPSASCLDTGIYTCLGNNTLNTELSSKQLLLFVNCSPWNSPLVPLLTNVTSQQNKPAVFSFTALAHPVPSKNDFQWFRKANGQWLPLVNDAAFKIDTIGLQSNLTILTVNMTLFGMYRLTVNNVIGGFEQIFHLVQEDKPEVPTYFINKQELVTVSSFTVQWKPGFDNGPEQTFILKYRKESQQEWTVVQIPDTRETLMNFTASDLSSGSNYQVVLYASNRLGNSSETDMLTISTKVIPKQCHCGSDRYQTIIVGVVFGLISVVVSVYGSYVTVVIRRIKRTKGQTKSSKENETKTQTYANLAYSINNSNGQQSTEQSDTAEYTTLDNRFRDDNKTYDNINAVH